MACAYYGDGAMANQPMCCALTFGGDNDDEGRGHCCNATLMGSGDRGPLDDDDDDDGIAFHAAIASGQLTGTNERTVDGWLALVCVQASDDLFDISTDRS